MRAIAIHLYSRTSQNDDGSPAYCGCWHVRCPDGDPRVADLDAAGVGRFRNEDGTVSRAYFFADELTDQLGAAERATGCDAEEEVVRTAPRGWTPVHHA